MEQERTSVVVASYNMAHLINDTIVSCNQQTYRPLEIIIYDDASTDNTKEIMGQWNDHFLKFQYNVQLKYICGERNLGVGKAFNEAIKHATGEYIVLMCSDDLFTNVVVLEDIVNAFKSTCGIGHVSRYYYQFINDWGKKHPETIPVRAWRTNDPLILANNPSGLAFRQEALISNRLSNRMFIESASLVYQVLKDGWDYKILPYDTVAVRVHDSTSTKKDYWLKRRVSSPVEDWYELGAKDILKDYCSLVQIKCNYKMSALWSEIWNFIRLRPLNLLSLKFIGYSLATVVLPRRILRRLPHLWRKYIGSRITEEITRP